MTDTHLIAAPDARARTRGRGIRPGRALPWLLALVFLVALLPATPAGTTYAAGSVAMPFTGGRAVKVVQGYAGGTHQGRSRFGLDLVLADGETSGAAVVSPIDGVVTYAQRGGNGCIAIAFKDDSYTVMMCHVALSQGFANGEAVSRGQTLGTVGAAGTVGNNGLPHIHLELHRGNSVSNPIPFAEPEGLLLEGISLPATNTTAVISKREPIVSSNGRGSGSGGGRTVPMSAPVTAASIPASVQAIPAGSGAAATSTATRKAVVSGTDSCLKVREKPAASAAVVGCLKDGAEVALKPLANGSDPAWRQTDQGWVSSAYLKRSQAVVTGTSGCLNVRETASASAAKLGCLPDGTAVTIVEGPTTAGGQAWYRIEPAGSVQKRGWVIGQYLD